MDWDRDVAFTNASMGFLNATAHDLEPVSRSRREDRDAHRLGRIRFFPRRDVIKYYEEVTETMGGAEKTKKFFRLFMAPGMGHCSGGPGPNSLDALAALEAWVEQGTASRDGFSPPAAAQGGAVERTRPLCVYPQVARWSGQGSTDDAANFSCVDPRAQNSR